MYARYTFWQDVTTHAHYITRSVIVIFYFTKSDAHQGKINRAQMQPIVIPDTTKNALNTLHNMHACMQNRTRALSMQLKLKTPAEKWPYRVNKALSLIQIQLYGSPVKSERMNKSSPQGCTVKIHLISPVVLARCDAEGNKLPNSLPLTSWRSYTCKWHQRVLFSTDVMSLSPSV